MILIVGVFLLTTLKEEGGSLEGGEQKDTYNYKFLKAVKKKAKKKEEKKKALSMKEAKKLHTCHSLLDARDLSESSESYHLFLGGF